MQTQDIKTFGQKICTSLGGQITLIIYASNVNLLILGLVGAIFRWQLQEDAADW